MTLRAAGPAACYLDVAPDPSPATARRIGALQRALLAGAPPQVRDVVPGFTSLLIEVRPGTSLRRLQRWLEPALQALEPEATAAAPAATERRVPVRYGEGADRAELEARLGLPWERIVALHAGASYTVAFLGFTPGFPYLLGLPAELVTTRRSTPRARVPSGSVAIAGDQAGLYPSASPGGWWILGRTDAEVFDAGRWPPRAWSPGDTVRFEPVGGTAGPGDADLGADPGTNGTNGANGAETGTADGPLGDPEAVPALEVVEAWPPSATLQAAPRWRVGHLGMAQAGALDPHGLELANAALGNAAHAAALELLAQPLTLRAHAPLTAALAGGGHRARLEGRPLAGGGPFAWPAGAVLELAPGGRAHGNASYLAIAGGFAAHRYGGSASTDLRAGVGGARRALLPGDLLAAAAAARPRAPAPGAAPLRPRYAQRVHLRVYPGPQFDADAFAALTGSRFRVAGFDRTGVRLDGPEVPQSAADVRSEGSPWGAIQLPADGRPIVLTADRGRTGGYAKPAIVDVRDLWRLAQAPIGTEVALVAAGRA